ncbi:hypothetical protein GWK08_07620 [Leptobacterium flavescens]|uniref:5'-Nucleotidase C-terminal domain-containing protein n=1 Tax=Leptobacterium flavescens TaxID=472055 RepID=A0A6P0UIV4_9FLAO|nr:5'-nucleotidase C-terminal domain-containing protein [Leptobacterium flavescens]NER13301.1 hypothetical protein [Leptobacterium flavescens]
MKIKHFVVFVTILLSYSCQNKQQLAEIHGKQININDSLTADSSIEKFVTPYRDHINKTLDEPLAYNVATISKKDTPLNTAIGNLLADLVYEQADPIFYSRTEKHIDFVLLNHGGIRAPMAKGEVSARTAYEIMPFENNIVVVGLPYNKIIELVNYLTSRKLAHPLSKHIQLTLNQDYSVKQLLIGGEEPQKDRIYYVATSNYLSNGGDSMNFFMNEKDITDTNYLIRNAMIDYFKKQDTIAPEYDQRFTIQ